MNSKLSEFELRQLRQMRQKIEEVKSRKASLSTFVSDQWAQLDMLDSVEASWKDRYRGLVNEIETIYALAAAAGSLTLEAEDLEVIDDLLTSMERELSGFTKNGPLN